MSKLLTILQNYGCLDLNNTMERFLGDEEFYLDILKQALDDDGFERLGRHLREHDNVAAFETAHMLKGMIANCGITPMYMLIDQIVEPLRKKEDCDLLSKYEMLIEKKSQLSELLAPI